MCNRKFRGLLFSKPYNGTEISLVSKFKLVEKRHLLQHSPHTAATEIDMTRTMFITSCSSPLAFSDGVRKCVSMKLFCLITGGCAVVLIAQLVYVERPGSASTQISSRHPRSASSRPSLLHVLRRLLLWISHSASGDRAVPHLL